MRTAPEISPLLESAQTPAPAFFAHPLLAGPDIEISLRVGCPAKIAATPTRNPPSFVRFASVNSPAVALACRCDTPSVPRPPQRCGTVTDTRTPAGPVSVGPLPAGALPARSGLHSAAP